MPNSYFQFKQFRIEQDKCAMKVCTDACIFGAVIPVQNAVRVLDIGTGTGLLALMAAQRSSAQIDAVEIDADAAVQAAENAEASPWSERIKVHRSALQQFSREKLYDTIICNPPFFLNSLRSEKNAERFAKHSDSLTFQEIIAFAASYLTAKGTLSILLPQYEQSVFSALAGVAGLHPNRQWLISNNAGGKVIRAATVYTRQQTGMQQIELIIKDANGVYTEDFRSLLKDFYLAF